MFSPTYYRAQETGTQIVIVSLVEHSVLSITYSTDAFQALRPNQFVPLSVPFEIHGYVSYEKRTERTQPDYKADIGIKGGLDIPSP